MIVLGIACVVIGAFVDRLRPLITVGIILVIVGALIALAGHPAY
jgi:hypothetical protein